MHSVFVGMPRRHRHTSGVAARARFIGSVLDRADGEALLAAAWLHDIGHHPALNTSCFHALDGARHLQGRFPERVVALVAHHSASRFEAAGRGLLGELAAFPDERSIVTEALTYCDLTTGPDGEHVDLAGRLTEIAARYGPDHVVTRSLQTARPALDAAVRRVERELVGASALQRSTAGPSAR